MSPSPDSQPTPSLLIKPQPKGLIAHATPVAFSMLYAPYVWSGKEPWRSLDCSGFATNILAEIEALERKEVLDTNAERLRRELAKIPGGVIQNPIAGAFVFYGHDNYASHVMYCLDAEWCIGAAGGGSDTVTIDMARARNARVKLHKIKYRPDILGYATPFVLD